MKKLLVLMLAVLFLGTVGMAKTNFFDNLYIDGTVTVVGTVTFGDLDIGGDLDITGTTTSDGKAIWGGEWGATPINLDGTDPDQVFQIHGDIDSDVASSAYAAGYQTLTITNNLTNDTSIFGNWAELYIEGDLTIAVGNQAGSWGHLELIDGGATNLTLNSSVTELWSAGVVGSLIIPDGLIIGQDRQIASVIATSDITSGYSLAHADSLLAAVLIRADDQPFPVGLYIDDGDVTIDIHLSNDETLDNVVDGDVKLIGDDTDGIHFHVISADHDTTGDASLVLDADAGGDDADTWTITSQATGNDLSILNHATEVMNLTSAGNVQFDGTAQVDGLANLNGGIAVDTDVFTVDGATGALTIAHTTPPDIILENTTAGSDADSGKFYWRGEDDGSSTDLDMSIFLDVESDTDYKLSFLADGATPEVMSIDQSGDLQMDGDLTVDGGEVIVSSAATDLVIAATTDAAFEIFDSTTKFFGIDTRITGVSGLESITLNPGPVTIPDGGTSTRNGIVVKAATTTLAGTTQITTHFDGLSLQVEVPTITRTGAVTVDQASTMYIAGVPVAAGDVTITAPYALEIGAGTFLTAGDVFLAAAAQIDIIIENTSTGADADSGSMYWRGEDHDTSTDLDMSIFLDVTSDTDYLLSFMDDGQGNEIASIDQGGNIQLDGDLTVDGGEVIVSGVASDIVIAGNTDAALEVYDSATKLLGFDTRNTVTAIETITLNPGAVTVPDAAGSTRNGVVIKTATTSAAGVTGITTPFDGLSFQVEAPELVGFGGGTIVSQASTMYIEGAPTAGANMTITVGYALEVEAGTTLLGGYLQFDGAQDVVVVGDTAAALDFSVATTPFLTFNTQNTTDNISNFTFTGIAASFASGAGSTKRTVTITPGTTTLDTVTGTTDMSGMGLYIAQPTITNDDAGTVAKASTVLIAAEPVAADAAVITAAYALEIASGDSLLAGNLEFGAALDILVVADTDAALEISDGTIAVIEVDTRDTVSLVSNVTITAVPSTITAAAGTTKRTLTVTPGTTTLDEANATTDMSGMGLYVDQPTITNDDIGTVAEASTIYIVGEPVAADAAAITAAYALEIASGDFLTAGDINVDGGEIDVASVATDIVVAADNAVALEFFDGTTPFIVLNTQVTTDNVSNVTFTGIPASFDAAAGSTKRTVTITPGTTTLDVANPTTNMSGIGLYVDQATITNDDVGTIAKASTIYIVAEPVAADAAVITAAYALEIASGDFLTAGAIEAVGDVKAGTLTIDDGSADVIVDSDDQTAGLPTILIPDFTDATADFLVTNVFTTWLPMAGGLGGEDTDGIATNGGGMIGGNVDITTHEYNDGTGGAADVHCIVYDTSDGVWSDLKASSARGSFGADYQLQPDAASEQVGDAFAIGFDDKFVEIVFDDLGTVTAGQLATYANPAGKWQYSDGAGSWADLTVFDNTSTGATTGTKPLQRTGAITFADPGAAWIVATYDGEEAYWVQWVFTAVECTQPAKTDSTNKDEPMIGIPSDPLDMPYNGSIVSVRVTNMHATVHDNTIKFVVGNFTEGTFMDEFTWTASQISDTFTPAADLVCSKDDIIGIMVTEDTNSTDNPIWMVELEVVYED